MSHIRSLVLIDKPISILNVGVGTGYTSELLKEFGTVTSIEYDEVCCQFVRDNTNLKIENGSISELNYPENEFDLVCAFDVVEHIEDDLLGVKELKRVCKKGGIVVVTVPAHKFLWSRHDEINHHFRRYKKSQLLDLFRGEGEFIYHSYYNTWLFPFIALFRFLNNAFKLTKETAENTGSDFSVGGGNTLVTKLLFNLFLSESFFIKKHISLPFGVSIISSWKK